MDPRDLKGCGGFVIQKIKLCRLIALISITGGHCLSDWQNRISIMKPSFPCLYYCMVWANKLVVSHVETQWYSRASFRRASWVVKRQLTGVAFKLRLCILASTSRRNVSLSGIRCARRMFDNMASSLFLAWRCFYPAFVKQVELIEIGGCYKSWVILAKCTKNRPSNVRWTVFLWFLFSFELFQ